MFDEVMDSRLTLFHILSIVFQVPRCGIYVRLYFEETFVISCFYFVSSFGVPAGMMKKKAFVLLLFYFYSLSLWFLGVIDM